MKRLLSLLLCLCLLLSLFPAALAEDMEASEPESLVLDEENAPEEPEEPFPEYDAELDESVPPEETAPTVNPLRVTFACEPADLALAVFDPAELDESGVRFLFRPETDGSYLLPDGTYAFDACREGYEPLYAVPFTLAGEALEIPVMLTALPGVTQNEDDQQETTALEEDGCAEFEEGWPNDTLLTQYVDRLFYPPVLLRGAMPELNLSAADYYVEQQLKAAVLELAAGTRSSTEITVPLGEYVYSDLAPGSIFHTLFKDATAELYWFSGRYNWGARDGNAFGCTLRVAPEYQDGDDSHVNAEKVQTAMAAVATAAAIVERYSEYDTVEKLRGYKNAVCELTDYDYSAAYAGSAVAGNDPWELVNVFDGDPSTKAVCEGYAKAFQYLCDQSSFDGGVNCICVSGAVYWGGSGSGGSHMWNLVSLEDGRNYLIDPTGCDNQADPDIRFLLSAIAGSADSTSGYTVSSGDRYSYYHRTTNDAGAPIYISDVLDAFPASMLRLSALPYGSEDAEIPLNEETFPDAGFLAVAAGFDADQNGALSTGERMAVSSLDVSGLGLESLAGLEHFSSLETLNCSGNSLTALALGENTRLKTLDCSNNALSALSLDANTLLEELDCSENSLTTLNLDENTYLRTLRCADMPLAELSFGKITALSKFDCGGTALESLDVSRCTLLVQAVLRGACSSTEGNTRYLLGTEDAPEALLRVPAAAFVDTGFISLNEAFFPDENFCSYVAAFDKDGDGLLSRSERVAVGSIDCSNLEICDLTGIAYFPSITVLKCSKNALTALDLSEFVNLRTLSCDENNLGSLDLRANSKLSYLKCNSAGLEELRLEGLTELKTLYCYSNSLTTLDLSTNSALNDVRIYSNRLANVTLGTQTALNRFYCYDNVLTSLNFSACGSLSDLRAYRNSLESLTLGTQSALNILYCYDNALSSLDLSACGSLSDIRAYRNSLTSLTLGAQSALSTLYCYGNSLASLDLSGCKELQDTCALGTMSVTSSYRQFARSPSTLRLDKALMLTAGSDTIWTTAENFYAYSAVKALLAAASAPESGDADKQLFSGWYRDAAFTQPVTAWEELGAAGAFAKFISMDVLNVAIQVRQQSMSGKEGASDLRFVSSVPAAGSYDKIGFELTLVSSDNYLLSNNAFRTPLYDRIWAGGQLYDLARLRSVGLFPEDGDSVKIAVQTVTGFPADFFADGNPYLFRVHPYLITNDGTAAFGREKYFRLLTDADGMRSIVITDNQGAVS